MILGGGGGREKCEKVWMESRWRRWKKAKCCRGGVLEYQVRTGNSPILRWSRCRSQIRGLRLRNLVW